MSPRDMIMDPSNPMFYDLSSRMGQREPRGIRMDRSNRMFYDPSPRMGQRGPPSRDSEEDYFRKDFYDDGFGHQGPPFRGPRGGRDPPPMDRRGPPECADLFDDFDDFEDDDFLDNDDFINPYGGPRGTGPGMGRGPPGMDSRMGRSGRAPPGMDLRVGPPMGYGRGPPMDPPTAFGMRSGRGPRFYLG
ncbi:MAG: hypothetical protein M1828_000750 [Chrysothrix sp. TS-e1954]|nr:MAG: hypothetical protein M1828_000750 [Chrysothrix sp. TS-e1954]